MSNPKRTLSDSPFFAVMGFLGDVVYLHLLWLLCCLPLVTVGAATTAAFAVADKMAAKQDYFVRRDFFAAFQRDWRLATRTWVALAAAGAVIAADYQIGLANPGVLGGGLIAVAAALGIGWLCAFGGSFALLGRFTYTGLRPLLRDGLMLCVTNPGAAFLWLALVLLMPFLRLALPPLYYYLLPPWTLFGGGMAAVAFAFALRPAFARLETK